MKYFLTNLIFLIPLALISQANISGIVLEKSSSESEIVLPGANVYWMDTAKGVVTNLDGEFNISNSGNYNKLIISYVGFKSDTINIENQTFIKHYLKPESTLDAVNIKAISKSSSVSYLTSQNIINVSSEELLKAACCNLSESFETNATVDVSYNDGVSGVKKIKMLGLDGIYTQITQENMPLIRGLSSSFGLHYTPGPYIESIQIIKGVGSVVNGFESFTGQINLEYFKPNCSESIYYNIYGNAEGKIENNLRLVK